jgi:hypothetical protein
VAKRDCEALLQELQRNKRNRTVKEVERVLAACGFQYRPTKREGNLWSSHGVALTLPKPHAGDKVLKLPYVVHVIRKIEEAREIAQGRDEEPD